MRITSLEHALLGIYVGIGIYIGLRLLIGLWITALKQKHIVDTVGVGIIGTIASAVMTALWPVIALVYLSTGILVMLRYLARGERDTFPLPLRFKDIPWTNEDVLRTRGKK